LLCGFEFFLLHMLSCILDYNAFVFITAEKANARPKLPRDRKRKTEKSDDQEDSNEPQVNSCLSNVGKRTKSAENKRISSSLLEEKKAQSPSPLKRSRSTDIRKSSVNTNLNQDSESLKQPVVTVSKRTKPVANKKPPVQLKKCDPRESHRTSTSPVISPSKRQRPSSAETKRSVRKINENRSSTPLKSSPRLKTDSRSGIRPERRKNLDKSNEKHLKNRTKNSVKSSSAVISSVVTEESHAEDQKGETSQDNKELSTNCQKG